MADENLIARIERFERTVATCLCAIPLFFAAPCIVLTFSVPVFEAMFADFGAKLPSLTDFMFHTRIWWLLLSLVLPSVALVVARRSKAIFSVVYSTATGLILFLIGQFLTYAAFLPIFELGKVAEGLK